MENNPIHILLVEDSRTHAELIREAFASAGEHFIVADASTLAEARRALAHRTPDIVLLDFLLPDGSGLDLMHAYRAVLPCPFLVLTSHGGEAVAEDAVKAGAGDYVIKSAEALNSLPQMVERMLREWRLIQRTREAEGALQCCRNQWSALLCHMQEPVVVNEIRFDDRANPVEWRILEVNPAALRLLQPHLDTEISSVQPLSWPPGPAAEALLHACRSVVQGNASANCEFTLPPSDSVCRGSVFSPQKNHFILLIHPPTA